MYGAIINIKIKDSEYTIIHAGNEPVLTIDLLTKVIVEFFTINRLRFTFSEYRDSIITVHNGESETTFAFKAKHVSPLVLRKIN